MKRKPETKHTAVSEQQLACNFEHTTLNTRAVDPILRFGLWASLREPSFAQQIESHPFCNYNITRNIYDYNVIYRQVMLCIEWLFYGNPESSLEYENFKQGSFGQFHFSLCKYGQLCTCPIF